MTYKSEIDINRNIEDVILLFEDPDNLSKWMEGFEQIVHLDGIPGERGSRSKFIFREGKRTVELQETILVKNLPEEFTAIYEARGVRNTSTHRFIPLPDNKTRFVSEQDFEFKGLMKLLAPFLTKSINKQSVKHQKAFKSFAESETK